MKVVRLLKLGGVCCKFVELCGREQQNGFYLFDGRLTDVCPEGF